jgi:hypothetical protein
MGLKAPRGSVRTTEHRVRRWVVDDRLRNPVKRELASEARSQVAEQRYGIRLVSGLDRRRRITTCPNRVEEVIEMVVALVQSLVTRLQANAQQ